MLSGWFSVDPPSLQFIVKSVAFEVGRKRISNTQRCRNILCIEWLFNFGIYTALMLKIKVHFASLVSHPENMSIQNNHWSQVVVVHAFHISTQGISLSLIPRLQSKF